MGEFAPGAELESPTRPNKTLPEREGGPLAVGESAPGAGSSSSVIPREKSIRPIQKSLLAESKEMKKEQINPM